MNKTTHRLFVGNSPKMGKVENNSIHLVVTSPPYPMIEMWDDSFSNQNKKIGYYLNKQNGSKAFEWMHRELDKVWDEIDRVLVDGGIACINIGDATRTINNNFQLFNSHSKILSKFQNMGFVNLPNIIWRKPTNSPTKFMGSGMYAPGAYVTLEHEYLLIFRKGGKREFRTEQEKLNRRQSSYFWEERNSWFSDIWFDLRGVLQSVGIKGVRERSAAYPFDLAYRLINMFSVKGDTVLDPFLGTGTTTVVAIASYRNSIGYDIDSAFIEYTYKALTEDLVSELNNYIKKRLDSHIRFVESKIKENGKDYFKYESKNYGFPVMTKQEVDIGINWVETINKEKKNSLSAVYYIDYSLDYYEKGTLFNN